MTQPPCDARQFSEAAERNAQPIVDVLQRRLPADATRVLEIAAGTGQHAVRFARELPHVTWQPTDPDPGALASIRAWREHARLPNVPEPLALDVCADVWPVEHAGAIVCTNLLHIAPWTVTPALAAGAARLLPAGGELLIYGPFRVGGHHTADSNARFDDQLRARDPAWGIRDLETVVEVMQAHGLGHAEGVVMPANNRMLAFRRAA